MFSYAASRRLRPVGITLAALLALAACSGSPQSSTSSVGGRDGVAVAPAPAPGLTDNVSSISTSHRYRFETHGREPSPTVGASNG